MFKRLLILYVIILITTTVYILTTYKSQNKIYNNVMMKGYVYCYGIHQQDGYDCFDINKHQIVCTLPNFNTTYTQLNFEKNLNNCMNQNFIFHYRYDVFDQSLINSWINNNINKRQIFLYQLSKRDEFRYKTNKLIKYDD